MFLISSDYERADWKDMIREQQKKCRQPCQQDAHNNKYTINLFSFAKFLTLCCSSGFKSVSLTSMELQMLTNSCVKLQTVHHIPLTANKEGNRVSLWLLIKH